MSETYQDASPPKTDENRISESFGHGSTRQLVDSTEAIVDTFSYDAYGVMLGGNPTSAPATSLLYAGEMFDTSSQMYYLRARWYNPSAGLFNRADTLPGNRYAPQSLHKYLYCHANPPNRVDPSGNMGILGWTITIIAVIAIAAILYKTNFFEFQRRGLGDSRITNNDITSAIKGYRHAIEVLPDVMATYPASWEAYQRVLNEHGVFAVGQIGVGVVGLGEHLGFGQQLIIRYFESPSWFAKHSDIFSLFPKIYEYDSDRVGWLQRQGEAELKRMQAVVDELEIEARRRGIPGY